MQEVLWTECTDNLNVLNVTECPLKKRKRRGQQRMRWSDAVTNLMDMSLSKLMELVMNSEAGIPVHGIVKSQTLLSN